MEGLETRILPLLRDHGAWEGLLVQDNCALPNRDWVTHVQKDWKPLVVADTFLVQLPWHNDIGLAKVERQRCESSSSSSSSLQPLIPLRLQGGIAFGTREHATTQLCLEWLGTKLRSATWNKGGTSEDHRLSILDYGTGSGILGIAACRLATAVGISVTATGVDIDSDACRIANVNAEWN
jgi:ribosomal protein L11 methyltransferase